MFCIWFGLSLVHIKHFRNTLKVYYMCYTCVACQWAEQLKIVQFEQIKRRLMAKVFNVFCFVETFPECLSTWFENVNDTLSQLFLRSIHESVDVPAFVFVRSIEAKQIWFLAAQIDLRHIVEYTWCDSEFVCHLIICKGWEEIKLAFARYHKVKVQVWRRFQINVYFVCT